MLQQMECSWNMCPKKDFIALYKRSLLCTGDSVGLLSAVQLVELS